MTFFTKVADLSVVSAMYLTSLTVSILYVPEQGGLGFLLWPGY